MNKADQQWRAEQDMHTLAEAKRIEADKTRHTAAKNSAASKIKELNKVVSKPTAKAPAKKK